MPTTYKTISFYLTLSIQGAKIEQHFFIEKLFQRICPILSRIIGQKKSEDSAKNLPKILYADAALQCNLKDALLNVALAQHWGVTILGIED